MSSVSPLSQYDAAKRMLAQAVRVDEVMHVRNLAERIALYGRQAKDRDIMANAMELQQRAERKLGRALIEAKAAGQISAGGRPRKPEPVPENGSAPEQVLVFTLEEAGIDRKLSMKAQDLARTEEAVFEDGVARAREKILAGAAALVNPSKDISTAGKKAARVEKEQRLGAKQRALPVAKFGVILTDDEWEFEARSEDGLDRGAVNHYPVSSLDELKKRDVASLAADDCALFMWTTVPHLAQAFELMAHRGFAYKSSCVWHKLYPGARHGTGYWFWVDHEILLVGTRGNVPAPAPGTQWHSVIAAPVDPVHSKKPDVFYELIESYFPSLPKIELNARTVREGWVRWGYEAPEADADGRVFGRPMDSAPRDGTVIRIRFEHVNFAISPPEDRADWEEICEAHWIDFNAGGWTWHGIAGAATCWWPLDVPLDKCIYQPPADAEQAEGAGFFAAHGLGDGEPEFIPQFLGRVSS